MLEKKQGNFNVEKFTYNPIFDGNFNSNNKWLGQS